MLRKRQPSVRHEVTSELLVIFHQFLPPMADMKEGTSVCSQDSPEVLCTTARQGHLA